MANTNTNSITSTKNGKYLKKTDVNSYVHYQFDTNDGIVYLSEKIDGTNGSGAAYAKDARLHDTLCALYTLASKGGQASTDLATLITKVNAHIQNVSNPHNVNKSQVGLGSVINAGMDDTPTENSNKYVKSGGVYHAIKNVSAKADQAISIANGQSHAYVFADVAGLRSGTLSSNQPISGYKVGDSIYIIAPDVSDFWISGGSSNGTASNANVINSAKKGTTVIVKWGSSYVSLTAFESKRDLSGYATTGALNNALANFYNKSQIEQSYVPYSGATDNVNIGEHTLIVGKTGRANQKFTSIVGGRIALVGLGTVENGGEITDVERKVELDPTGIVLADENKTYPYPRGASSPIATEEFVIDQKYQTGDQVVTLINAGTVKLKGDVTGNGKVSDGGITTTLSNTGITAGTYSALTVDAKGRATAGAQQIVFASTINDSALNNLVIGGIAIVDA